MNEQLIGLKAAMKILPDAVMIVDNNQEIVGCNGIAETLFGYRHGELTGKQLSVLIPPAMRKSHAKLMANHVPSDGKRPMQNGSVFYGISKSGLKLPLSIGISTIGTNEDKLFIAVVRDASNMNDTLEGVAVLAETDPLTKLGNRRHLTSILEELERDPERTAGLLFLDLDEFKPINDEYGHETGDEVLRIVARRIRGSLRPSDICVRLGGDEFVVVLPGLKDSDSMTRIALKLQAGISAPMRLGAVTTRVGVSIGGVIGSPHAVGGQDLLKRADEAMYVAKREGLPYSFHDAPLTAAA